MPRSSNPRSKSANLRPTSAQVDVVGRDHKPINVQYRDADERENVRVPDITGPETNDNEPGEVGNKPRRPRLSAVSPPSAVPSMNASHAPATQEDTAATPEYSDTQERGHKKLGVPRNIDKVNFGRWQIKTWYFSPYPLAEPETDDTVGNSGTAISSQDQRIQAISRSAVRSHGRASDLLTGGSGRMHLPILWVCDRCFKYMVEGVSWELHVKTCTRKHPPGRKVYQRGAHTIWEVDGSKEKLYCQNLSLFGKLFIDVKTLFFDCDNFLFYLMTDADSQRDHVLGFFSKEKMSYDDYNLACIITLPPYQRKRYGMLMIEFSYELSRRACKVGTPERPLSDLGLRSYLTYWISTLVRFFRRLLSVMPLDMANISLSGKMPDVRSLSRDIDDGTPRTRKKRFKGWDGEAVERNLTQNQIEDNPFSSLREIDTTFNSDGSATSHVVVRCTLRDIARATNLRTEDTAFALKECGLLSQRQSEGDNSQDVVTISREMVEAVAKERRVKDLCLDHAHVLL